jgi:hypothetical protein
MIPLPGDRKKRWIPSWEMIEPTAAEKGPVRADVHLTNEVIERRRNAAALMCWFRARYTHLSIEEKDAWRKPRRIRSICLHKIRWLVEDLRDLRDGGVKVLLPWEFFQDEKPPMFKGILRSPDLRGPLQILVYQNKKTEWIRPSLTEWGEYVEHVMKELMPFYEAYTEGHIPGPTVLRPARMVTKRPH